MSTFFKSRKSETIGKLVAENENSVTLCLQDTEEEKVIARSTLKRWWRPYEPVQDTLQIVEEVIKEKEPEEVFEEVPKPEKEVKAPKAKAEANNDYSDLFEHTFNFMDRMKEACDVTIFSSDKVKGFYSMKKDDKMYMVFNFSKKSGVTLWLRSKAVKGLVEYTHYNHAFDARVNIREWNSEIANLVSELHRASLEFQLDKNSKSKK